MNTYLLKGPLIELSLGGKKEEKKRKWEKNKKKKWGTIVSVSRGNKWWSATLGRSYWMHHPACLPICSSCDENIRWGYYFLSKINSERNRFPQEYFFKGFEVAWCSSSSSWGLGRWATLDIHNWTGPLPPPPPPSFISNRHRPVRRGGGWPPWQDWWGLGKQWQDWWRLGKPWQGWWGSTCWNEVELMTPPCFLPIWGRSLAFGWTEIYCQGNLISWNFKMKIAVVLEQLELRAAAFSLKLW